MSVVPFIDPKMLRLHRALEELIAAAIEQAMFWEGVPSVNRIEPKNAEQLMISSVTLLRIAGDRLEKRFLKEMAQRVVE